MAESPRSQTGDRGWTAPAIGAMRSEDGRILQHTFTSLREHLGTVGDTISNNTPVGAMTMYAGTSAPTGWLLCQGQQMAISEYASLYAVVGTTYGALTNGSGSAGTTHFRLPDLRSRVPVGAGQGTGLSSRALGATAGVESVTLTEQQIPSHNHTQNAHGHTTVNAGSHAHTLGAKTVPSGTHGHTQQEYLSAGSGASGNVLYTYSSMNTAGDHGHTINNTTATNNATGGGQSHDNMQPWLGINYIIKF